MIDSYRLIYGDNPPPLIRILYEILMDEDRRGGSSLSVILMAPTGYGKSKSVPPIAHYLSRNISGLGSRVIHVLPYRSVLEDLYNRTIDRIKAANLSLNVGVQYMYTPIEIKLPFFLGDYILTTLDSFILNLFKFSVGEAAYEYPHYEIPRYAIYTSIVVFDEAHLFYSEGNYEKNNERMNETFLTTLNILSSDIPIIILSATISRKRLTHIINELKSRSIYVIKISDRNNVQINGRVRYIDVFDNKYINKINLIQDKVSAKPVFITGFDMIKDLVESKFNEGIKSVLIVLNKLKNLGIAYRMLSDKYGDIIYLLHSYFTIADRKRIIREINRRLIDGLETILICSPIVEVGINLDFDYLITEASPLSSMIQRLGRVLRNLDKINDRYIGLSIIELREYNGIYNSEYVKKTLEYLKKLNLPINWRLPLIQPDNVSYMVLLDEIENQILDIRPSRDMPLHAILNEIDSSIDVSGRLVRKLLKHMGGLVRDEALISLYLPKNHQEYSFKIQTELEVDFENIVPITISKLLRLIKNYNDFLIRDKDGRYLYLTNLKNSIILDGTSVSVFDEELRRFYKGMFSNKMYLLNPRYYNSKLGIYPILGV